MSPPPQSLQLSKLLKRPVLDRQTVEELGRLSQLLVDAQAQRVTGLLCKSGWWGTKQAFSWPQIEAIGDDSILVRSTDSRPGVTPEMVEAPIGFEMFTDRGNRVGYVTDVLFHAGSGEIIHYLFTPQGWQGLVKGSYLLAPVAISSVGEKRVIVLDAAVETPQQYTPGLGDKLNQATDFIQADYQRTKQDLASWQRGAEGWVAQVKGTPPSPDPSLEPSSTAEQSPLPPEEVRGDIEGSP
jgi:uncharacterized protein YrrD